MQTNQNRPGLDLLHPIWFGCVPNSLPPNKNKTECYFQDIKFTKTKKSWMVQSVMLDGVELASEQFVVQSLKKHVGNDWLQETSRVNPSV